MNLNQASLEVQVLGDKESIPHKRSLRVIKRILRQPIKADNGVTLDMYTDLN